LFPELSESRRNRWITVINQIRRQRAGGNQAFVSRDA